jgi:hypothetical protein
MFTKEVEVDWKSVTEICPLLEELNLVEVSDSAIQILAEHCRNLTTLEVTAERMTDASVHALAEHCRQLHTLTLRDSDKISGQALVHLTSVCKMRQLGLRKIQNITADDLDQILANCPNLQSFVMGTPTYSGFRYHRLSTACPLLQELTLMWAIPASGSLRLLSARPPDLRKLALIGWSECSWITNANVMALVRSCPNLAHLDFSHSDVGDQVLTCVAAHCHRTLQVLMLRGAYEVTGEGILAVARACPQLRSLSFPDTKNKAQWQGQVCALCPHLRRRTGCIHALGEQVPVPYY